MLNVLYLRKRLSNSPETTAICRWVFILYNNLIFNVMPEKSNYLEISTKVTQKYTVIQFDCKTDLKERYILFKL